MQTCATNWALALAGVLLALIALPAAATPNDEAEMVLVPAGAFTMGSPGTGLDEDAAERPTHEVTLPAFLIDKYEVTNAQYARFLNATGKLQDGAGHGYLWQSKYLQLEQVDGVWRARAGMERHPIACVSWYGATAYAAWAGKRLPTEAEWEKAARGSDGRKFPWGSELDLTRLRIGSMDILPVGGFPAGVSPSGCLDMSGNVWEWTGSLFRPYPYDPADGREDPQAQGRRVARGGSWAGEPYIAHAAARFRPEPGFGHLYLGFRCAMSEG